MFLEIFYLYNKIYKNFQINQMMGKSNVRWELDYKVQEQ